MYDHGSLGKRMKDWYSFPVSCLLSRASKKNIKYIFNNAEIIEWNVINLCRKEVAINSIHRVVAFDSMIRGETRDTERLKFLF